MRHELSTLELRILVRELNAVKGYYIDQFYQLDDMRFRMKLSSKEGKINLNIEIPHYAALSNSGEVSEEATGFAMAVRKRVSGARIADIALLSNDRIIKIGYERKEEKGSMILEMFGKGNLIIVDEKMETLLALQTHEFTDRSVRKSEPYKPPKNDSVDLGDMKAVETVFTSIGTTQAADRMVSYLSKRLGLGSLYVDDAIRRQGLDPKIKVKDVDEKNLKAIRQRVAEIIERQGKAIMYMKEGMPEDFAVAELDRYSGLEKREMPLNEAVELFYSSRPKVVTQNNEEVERIEASLKRQEEIIKEMQREEVACRAKGEFISTNVTALNNLIKLASSKRADEDELMKAATGFKIKRIDRAKRSITIETDDAK